MTDTTTQPAEQTEAQALASAQAGYEGKARASAPAEPTVQAAAPLANSEQPASASPQEPDADDEPNPSAEPAAPSEAEQLRAQMDDLKAHVRQLSANGADGNTVRKMHGEIGEINRLVKQLATASTKDTPAAEDKLAAALKRAEATAAEYPEIGGPFFEALKELQSRIAQPAEPKPAEVKSPSDMQQQRMKERQEEAIRALDEVHPDRHQLKDSPEFKAWFAKKPPEYQKKVTTSWNPAVVAEPFTDFKAYRAARQRKQEQLDAAVQPTGTPTTPQPTTIPDEQGAFIGYNRARQKRL